MSIFEEYEAFDYIAYIIIYSFFTTPMTTMISLFIYYHFHLLFNICVSFYRLV